MVASRYLLHRSVLNGRRDYDHLASLWEIEGWQSAETAQLARTHYSAYSVQRTDGLRIITVNTDFCAVILSKGGTVA